MKKMLLSVVALFSVVALYSQEVVVTKDLRYGDPPGGSYEKSETNDRTFDLYMPAGVTAPVPVIIFIHGGGFNSNDKYSEASAVIFNKLAAEGYAVMSINYRLYLKYKGVKGVSCTSQMSEGLRPDGEFHPAIQKAIDAASEDAVMAIDWVKKNGKKYNLDSKKIVLAGGSAGAMTALNVAYNMSTKVSAVIDMWGGMAEVATIKKSSPPIIIFHGDKDASINIAYSEAIKAQADKVGVTAVYVVIKGKGHAIYSEIGSSDKRIKQIVDFLKAAGI